MINNDKSRYWDKLYTLVIWISIVVALIIFFISIHPYTVFDTDDWNYISGKRILYPSMQEWNPVKILPEIMMPFIGNIAAYLVYPLKGNYYDSLSIAYGISAIFSIFIVLFLYYMALIKVLKISNKKSALSVLLFLLVSFVIYKNQNDMMYFFYAKSVNVFFNYDFPGIINWATVILISLIIVRTKSNILKSDFYICVCGGVTVLIYLSINSNIIHSIILISFVSSVAFLTVIENIKNHKGICKIIKNIWCYVFIDICWLVSLLFEINGGRAKSFSSTQLDILGVLRTFYQSIFGFNKYWFAISCLIIIVSFVLAYTEKNEIFVKAFTVVSCSLIITSVYTVLLCARVSEAYITLPQVLFGCLLYFQLLANISFIYLMRNGKINILIPFIIFILIFSINNNIMFYRESNMAGYKYNVCKRVSEDIITQICNAEKNGKRDIVVYVPYYGEEKNDNWPLALYGGQRIANALYRHNVVSSIIHVTFVRDERKNTELFLP